VERCLRNLKQENRTIAQAARKVKMERMTINARIPAGSGELDTQQRAQMCGQERLETHFAWSMQHLVCKIKAIARCV